MRQAILRTAEQKQATYSGIDQPEVSRASELLKEDQVVEQDLIFI